MKELMQVEIYEDEEWKSVAFEDLEPGMKFRLWNTVTESFFVGNDDKTEFVASGRPYKNEDGVATIDIICVSYEKASEDDLSRW